MTETKSRIRPLSDRVLVQLIAPPKQHGRILLPDSAKQPPANKGKVLAVGPGKMNGQGYMVPMPVQVGETVIFTHWSGVDAGDKLMGDDGRIVVLEMSDVQAVVDE